MASQRSSRSRSPIAGRPRPGTLEWRDRVMRDHPRAYAAWSDEEDIALCEEHLLGHTIDEIVRIHQRRRGAISSRLRRLGRTDAEPNHDAERLQQELRQLLHAIGDRSRAFVIRAYIDRASAEDLAQDFDIESTHAHQLAERSLDRLHRLVSTDGSPQLRSVLAAIESRYQQRSTKPSIVLLAPAGLRPAAIRLMLALACPPAVLERPGQGSNWSVFPQGARAPLVQRSHGRT